MYFGSFRTVGLVTSNSFACFTGNKYKELAIALTPAFVTSTHGTKLYLNLYFLNVHFIHVVYKEKPYIVRAFGVF